MKLMINKKIIYVILSGFVIVNMCGCKDNKLDNHKIENNYQNETILQEDETIIQNNKKENTIENETIIQNNIKNYTEKDNIAITTFTSLETEVDELLNQDFETIKDKLKGIFITTVDFIFYDSEINGVTFDELTEEGKQKILEIASKIDLKIENKFPNYKDTIFENTSLAFNKASELIKEGANNIKEFSKEKLGEDNYNKIIETKDKFIEYSKEIFSNIGNFSSDLYDSGKQYIKEWYKDFKN